MTELDHYLARHYLNAQQLAAASDLPLKEIDALIASQMIPAPAYTVSAEGLLHSHVFGVMPAPGALPGRYFHPSQLSWIAVARAPRATAVSVKARFVSRFAAALAALNLSTWRLRDCFDDGGGVISEGLRALTESAWTFFLNGTFSLCVANPVSEAHIAYKEVLQEKLTHVSENGQRSSYPAEELVALLELISAYAKAAMPFSPIEYPRSSRKRLVEDLRARLAAELT